MAPQNLDMFKTLNFQSFAVANSAWMAVALLGYGTIAFLWQSGKKRNLRSSPVLPKRNLATSLYKCNSTSTPVGSENWRPQSFRFESRIFASNTAAPRLTRRGFSVFAFPRV